MFCIGFRYLSRWRYRHADGSTQNEIKVERCRIATDRMLALAAGSADLDPGRHFRAPLLGPVTDAEPAAHPLLRVPEINIAALVPVRLGADRVHRLIGICQ